MSKVQLVVNGVARGLLNMGVNPSDVVGAVTEVSKMQVEKVVYDGAFTMVTIKDGSGLVSMGCSKRNPKDVENPIRGDMLALSRAVRNALLERVSQAKLVNSEQTG